MAIEIPQICRRSVISNNIRNLIMETIYQTEDLYLIYSWINHLDEKVNPKRTTIESPDDPLWGNIILDLESPTTYENYYNALKPSEFEKPYLYKNEVINSNDDRKVEVALMAKKIRKKHLIKEWASTIEFPPDVPAYDYLQTIFANDGIVFERERNAWEMSERERLGGDYLVDEPVGSGNWIKALPTSFEPLTWFDGMTFYFLRDPEGILREVPERYYFTFKEDDSILDYELKSMLFETFMSFDFDPLQIYPSLLPDQESIDWWSAQDPSEYPKTKFRYNKIMLVRNLKVKNELDEIIDADGESYISSELDYFEEGSPGSPEGDKVINCVPIHVNYITTIQRDPNQRDVFQAVIEREDLLQE